MKIVQLRELTSKRPTLYSVIAAVIWSLVYMSFVAHDYFREGERGRAIALAEARALAQRDRQWIAATCGTLYAHVVATEGKRSPLGRPDTITAADGSILQRVNSVVLTEILNTGGIRSGVTMHLRSASALAASDQGDAWQESAFAKIRGGDIEAVEETRSPDGPVLQFMAPVPALPSCLSCHDQPAAAGQRLLGAVSVAVPLRDALSSGMEHVTADAVRFTMIWLGGMVVLFVIRARASARQKERDRIEAALGESTARYERIVSTGHVGIWELDEKSNTSFVNRRMAEMLGYTTEEMAGRPMFDFMGEEERAQAARNFDRRVQGIEEQHEFCFRCSDGTPLWTLVSTRVILDDHAGFKGALGIITDITERKRVENNLKASEELLRMLVESTDDIVTMQDLDGRYLYFNGPASRYGVTEDQVVRRTPEELFDPATAKTMMDQIQRVAEQGEPIESELRIPWRGEEIWMQSRRYPVRDVSGRVVGVSTFSRNVTQQKRAQEELRQAQERLKTETLRARIAADLHDDIGSTLSSTSIFATMLRRNLEKKGWQPQELLTRIDKNLSEVQESLHDIVWSINPENDNLENIILKMRDYAGEVLNAQQIALRLDIPEAGAFQEVSMAGRRLIYLVFKEAMNNIIRHSHATEVTLAIAVTEGSIKITVSDNGVGFELGESIWGNGMINMRNRARSIGGSLHIRSARGRGTTVNLLMPIT